MAKSLAIASLQILSLLLLASLGQSKTVSTHLTVYEHEIRSGRDQTVFFVAGLPNVTWGFNKFGSVLIADNILTRGASFKSALVGRFQGIGAVASLDASSLETLASIVFTSGEYSGSTLELKGIGIGSEKVNEMAIVGGTKKFRYATGYTTFEAVSVAEDLVTARWDLYIRQDLPDDFPGIALQ